jgi:hypothetical protein
MVGEGRGVELGRPEGSRRRRGRWRPADGHAHDKDNGGGRRSHGTLLHDSWHSRVTLGDPNRKDYFQKILQSLSWARMSENSVDARKL